eukprot:5185570-Amphidinium_carterae.2
MKSTLLSLGVDLLHAFLQHQINQSELKVSARKYVDDMVLSATGKGCAYDLRTAFKSVKKTLEALVCASARPSASCWLTPMAVALNAVAPGIGWWGCCKKRIWKGSAAQKSCGTGTNLKGGVNADPQVTIHLESLLTGQEWPPTAEEWNSAETGHRGRGPVRHLHSLCERRDWKPEDEVFPLGGRRLLRRFLPATVMASVVSRRPEFEAIERRLDGPTIEAVIIPAEQSYTLLAVASG